LENIENGVGISYGLALDHEQPLLIEIQALVHNTGNSFGRREATGTNQTKLNIIIALLEKYLNLDLKSYDVYTQILGLPKGLNDDSLDLGIALAILSSLKNLALDQILEKTAPINIPLTRSKEEKGKKSDSRSIYCGRLTLSGSVRNATNQKSRQDSAKKLGFKYNQALENLKEISELRKILN
jgi:DNA repair protein RadA/Sms